MASNPMQKKARTSFFLGMFVAVIILGAVIGFLLYQIYQQKQQETAVEEDKISVYVLNKDVKSGEVITSGMYKLVDVESALVPDNAITSTNKISNVFTTDGDIIYAKVNEQAQQNEKISYYIEKEGNKYTLLKDNSGRDATLTELTTSEEIYYRNKDNNKVTINLAQDSIVAKFELYSNTILTRSLLTAADEITTDDLREQELNMVVLPTYLAKNDYIDIRLTLPSGEDFIVVSKKKIKDTNETTVWIDMTAEEILTLSNAIVEAYQIVGSKLYANTYVEPGVQASAEQTYIPRDSVISLISSDSNILQEAKNALAARYNSYNKHRGQINTALAAGAEDAQENTATGVQKSTEIQAKQREDYLAELKAKQTAAATNTTAKSTTSTTTTTTKNTTTKK